jgi:hypothetical protein
LQNLGIDLHSTSGRNNTAEWQQAGDGWDGTVRITPTLRTICEIEEGQPVAYGTDLQKYQLQEKATERVTYDPRGMQRKQILDGEASKNGHQYWERMLKLGQSKSFR